MRSRLPWLLATVLGATVAPACAADSSSADGDELGASAEEANEIVLGPLAKASDAEVWSIENQWADKTTPNARKEGVAWPADSGLTWEEKFSKWISSFERVEGLSNWTRTIRFKTPWGRTLDGPVLECADVGIWLRMSFASFYHLPFFMTGVRAGQPIYFGHFGVVDKEGNPVSGFARFKTQYRDYEKTWKTGDPWPSDARLRGLHVGSDDGAARVKIDQGELPEGAGAGAYFDELFLNKRAGYLMVLLDANFGSANLADGANMFHIVPEAITPGDLLVERWQRTGIGHTLPVVSVDKARPDRYHASVASGSMPRRQPSWEEPNQSAHYFQQDNTGGVGDSYDGSPYAKLGGGLRRWRTPVVVGGRWQNIVASVDRAVYIKDSDLARISARPKRFESLLAEDSPEEARDALLASIDTSRHNLHDHPASCSSRTSREESFARLYELMADKFSKTRAEVDAEYRKPEDYVFAELDYPKSKTCCWNSTTPQMFDIVMDYATKEKAKNEADRVCRELTVFKASGGGKYDLWKNHAASLGRAADWKTWSEDEPCAQRAVAEDTLGQHGSNAMCPPAPPPPQEQQPPAEGPPTPNP